MYNVEETGMPPWWQELGRNLRALSPEDWLAGAFVWNAIITICLIYSLLK